MSSAEAAHAAETAARQSYGKLLSVLAVRTRDIAAAEDALAEAFVAALDHWPTRGVPENPDAWLLTVARNRFSNTIRHRDVAQSAAVDIGVLLDGFAPESDAVPDERLRLLFVCAHPSIDAGVRTPLMLQTVLGMDAAAIAAAFLVSPATMSQRLVRAKTKIRDAGLRFELPDIDDLPERLADVLEAIYAAYGRSWDDDAGCASGAGDLAAEALFLGRLVVQLLPEAPEPKGLLALMLYCESRRAARRTAEGAFVPLAQQNAALWSREMIVEAEQLLTAASRARTFGRFQCEAAIQSVHVQRPITGVTNHEALLTLYGLLESHVPTAGARVGHAAVLLDLGRVDEALALLRSLAPALSERYQPYWVALARACAMAGQAEASRAALLTALSLTPDAAVQVHLRAQLPAVVSDPEAQLQSSVSVMKVLSGSSG